MIKEYRVVPSNNIEYYVFADEVYTDGEWIKFFTNNILVHACSARFTQYVYLVDKKSK